LTGPHPGLEVDVLANGLQHDRLPGIFITNKPSTCEL
jgi:hypothetical protein